jgi:hypothetical protein
MAYGIDSLTNGNIGNVSVTVNGGYVKSTYRAIRQFLNSATAENVLTINGGTVEGANKSVFFHDPSTKANNGTLEVGAGASLAGDVYLFVTAGSTDRRVFRAKELPNIIGHEVGSTSGDRWRTGYNGYEQINTAGVPAGFEIFDVKGRKITWHYRSETGDSKPFRVYDMAGVGEYYRENLDMQNLLREYPKTIINYGAKEFSKFVYINWWGHERSAKLQVFEDNKPLRVRQIWQADPLFVATSTAITLKHSRNKPRFGRNNCPHLFRVQRTSPTSTIKVRSTDPFGRVSEEIFVGKKPFLP